MGSAGEAGVALRRRTIGIGTGIYFALEGRIAFGRREREVCRRGVGRIYGMRIDGGIRSGSIDRPGETGRTLIFIGGSVSGFHIESVGTLRKTCVVFGTGTRAIISAVYFALEGGSFAGMESEGGGGGIGKTGWLVIDKGIRRGGVDGVGFGFGSFRIAVVVSGVEIQCGGR